MGALCCCPSQEDLEEYASYPNGSLYQHCFCVRCCVHRILSLYSTAFGRVDRRGAASASSASAGLLGISSPDTSPPDTYRPPPRPLPYDVDPRYLHLQRDGLVSRREKTSMYLHEESEPLRRDNGSCETITTLQKKIGVESEEQSQGFCTEKPEKCQSSKTTLTVESAIALIEEEDICPTCLDEYTAENPKISTQCAHHFHLGCIYEWMERSDNCPVCGKMIIVRLPWLKDFLEAIYTYIVLMVSLSVRCGSDSVWDANISIFLMMINWKASWKLYFNYSDG